MLSAGLITCQHRPTYYANSPLGVSAAGMSIPSCGPTVDFDFDLEHNGDEEEWAASSLPG